MRLNEAMGQMGDFQEVSAEMPYRKANGDVATGAECWGPCRQIHKDIDIVKKSKPSEVDMIP